MKKYIYYDYSKRKETFRKGKINTISYHISYIKNIFTSMGFTYVNGPDIENIYNNFTLLNIDKKHVSRNINETFYVNNYYDRGLKYLMRTHTSGIQIRHLLKYKSPIKVFSIGKVYRPDHDNTHSPVFHQIECIKIDKNSNIIDLKKTIYKFISLFFKKKGIYFRLRNSYFPFTDPSFELDIKDINLYYKKSKIIENINWIEVLGCGMISSKLLKKIKLNSNRNTGFAIGIGLERIIMIKRKIKNIRNFYNPEIPWLDSFGF